MALHLPRHPLHQSLLQRQHLLSLAPGLRLQHVNGQASLAAAV
jgi:hypothetical protein